MTVLFFPPELCGVVSCLGGNLEAPVFSRSGLSISPWFPSPVFSWLRTPLVEQSGFGGLLLVGFGWFILSFVVILLAIFDVILLSWGMVFLCCSLTSLLVVISWFILFSFTKYFEISGWVLISNFFFGFILVFGFFIFLWVDFFLVCGGF